MSAADKTRAVSIYLCLAALFITSLVVSNLIFQKFFYWKPFGDVTVFGAPIFELSVGILPYPVTFLITDVVSEVFGRKKANQIVTAGIFASFFSLAIILVSIHVGATEVSPLDDATFSRVFALSPLAVFASMLAYLSAQYVDIGLYHFWKRVTKGRMLWLRNNFSTFTSQTLDTLTVIGLLCLFGVIPWEHFKGLVISGVLFKMFMALMDTPILYFIVYLVRKRFNLKIGEEISLD